MQDQRRLALMLEINAATKYRADGVLIWTTAVRKKDRAGQIAGTLSPSDGYRYVKTGGLRIAAHRIIFLRFNGHCPDEVDHKNRKRDDNRIENLRDPVKAKNNLGNQAKQGGRSSKFKGVVWDKNRKKWISSIKIAGRQTFLGRYADEQAAADVYDRAATEHFEGFGLLNRDMPDA